MITPVRMNNRKGKSNNQLSLSQSLLRKKNRKLELKNDKLAVNTTDGNASNVLGPEEISFSSKTKNTTSYSQPENNDFDDSFDLFLPRRSPKKLIAPKAPSSQSSFFDVKKTSKSRYFDESGQLQVPNVIKDDDLELAIAVSLQESRGSAVNLKPLKSTSGPAPRGKLKKACSQSLLMRRSAADRERIITEKVAIVLMNTKKISALPSQDLEPRQPRLLYSAFLNERFNTLNTLWNLSQADLTKVQLARFYTHILIYYVDTPFPDRDSAHLGASTLDVDSKEGSGDLQLVVSDDDMFASSGDESYQGPSPKRPRSDELSCSPHDVNVSTSPGTPKSEIGLQTGSREVDSANTGNLSAVNATNLSSDRNERCSNASGEDNLLLRLETSGLNTMENIEDCSKSPFNYDAETPLRKARPREATIDTNNSTHRSINSSLDHGNSTFGKHMRKLCADLSSLTKSDFSSIIKIRKGSETLHAHGCVFKVRCPALLKELEKNSGCLDEFSLEVCQAVFGYIYAGRIDKALSLKLGEKNQLIECCLRFGLEELAEELFPKSGEENVKGSNLLGFAVTNQLFAVSPSEKAGVRGLTSELQNVPICSDVIPGPEKVNDDIIVLDSDCCSANEGYSSERLAREASDDELDLYLKDGVRLLEKNSSTPRHAPALEQEVGNGGSPSKTKEPKRSIERYFRDSFPSLDGISVTPTHQPGGPPEEPTPCSSKGIRNCVTPGGQLVVSEVATPFPDYESMVSPALKDALQKYGIKKGIGRRKAITLLRYIYDQIHPPSDHPAVAKAIDDIKSKAKANPTPDSDSDVYTLSSDSSGDVEIFEDLGDVFHSQAEVGTQEPSTKPGLLREVGTYIKSNTLLYAAVLKYEPIWLKKFHQSLKETGIKCNKKELIDVLDELGITFRTEQSEKQLQRRRNRKPARRKK